MGFESVRGYVQLASGLSEMTRARAIDAAARASEAAARATEAAQALLSLPAAGIATGSKVAGQAGSLAEDLLAAATTNHSSLTALVRSEVDVAVTRLGLVSAEKLEEAQAEATRLRTEVARLRAGASDASTSAPSTSQSANGTTRAAAPARSRPAKGANGTTRAVAPKQSRTAKSASPTGTAKSKVSGRTAKTNAKKTSKPSTATTASRSAVSTRVKPAGR